MTILIIVLLYEVVSIGGVSLAIIYKERKKAKSEAAGNFVTAGRDLPTVIVGVSLALAVLGAVHVFGIMEMAWGLGAAAVWFSIAHVTLLCVVCLCTGRWVRRMKVSTVPEMLEKLFDKKLAMICTCVIAGQTFAILTMEVQALGIIVNTLTFNAVSIQVGAVIGGVIGIFYVILAGMKEIGYVNLINTIVMYVGLILAVIFLTGAMPGGWDGVESYYKAEDMDYMLSVFGGPGVFVTFGLSNIIAVTFAQGISQMGLQSAMAAKSEKTIVKALWVAAPVNGLFGVFTAGIGVAAKALYESGELTLANPALAAKTAGATMLVEYLPTWLVGWLLAAFLGAVLSTFAITTMGLGALFSENVYTLKNPNATPEQKTKIVRLFIVITGVVAMVVSSYLPEIINGATWAFAWLCPIFWCVVYALFWKKSSTAVGITFAVSWIIVLLWTYTPLPHALGISGVPLPYMTLGTSLVVGIIAHIACKGDVGYFQKQKLESPAKLSS